MIFFLTKSFSLSFSFKGCGKTSLMKLLANDMPYGRAHGDLYFNKKSIDPHTHHQFSFFSFFFFFSLSFFFPLFYLSLPFRNVSYVTQEDAHVPSLTVRQTLEFAGNLLVSFSSPLPLFSFPSSLFSLLTFSLD